eukprot:7348115-Alexandrium_andersonii.AAC.1
MRSAAREASDDSATTPGLLVALGCGAERLQGGRRAVALGTGEAGGRGRPGPASELTATVSVPPSSK